MAEVIDCLGRDNFGTALLDWLAPQLRDSPHRCGPPPTIMRLTREDMADASYGEQLWDRIGLVDRLSALAALDGRWTAVNLCRDQARGCFAPGHVRPFSSLAPLLLALLRRHRAMRQPSPRDAGTAAGISPEAAAALLLRLPVRLSEREREASALTLTGRSREGIGLALGIAPGSVATLRGRAYRKLQVHGAVELVALCLACAPGKRA
jgi:DNA-binding CsgD family transcriptional regulator